MAISRVTWKVFCLLFNISQGVTCFRDFFEKWEKYFSAGKSPINAVYFLLVCAL